MTADPPAAPVFTVFTATYNRAHTLTRVYDSLCAQTFRDFEWLVVDDGSTDATAQLVNDWAQKANFPIRYVAKANGGKHTAWNLGVGLARGQFFLSLDSDDACTPDALESFYAAWQSIEPARRSEFTGVCCLVADPQGQVVGDRFPADVFDSDSNALRYRHRVKGEKWGFHRTEVARENLFPELPGTSYVPESIVWGRIASRYKERFINKALRIYFQDPTEHSRLTLAPMWKNPAALALGARAALEERLQWFAYDPKFFFWAAAIYARTSWHAGDGLSRQWRQLPGRAARALWFAMLPVAWWQYRRDTVRRRALEHGGSVA
ncbi:glycosyltransferase family 2 protein [Ideonella sp. BN130291]|uniref:glycosyltransferase family 2 protein n=1 Tax=Ideonella sp. BN130291 TaxID=3112940 RepID=UPI002E27340F|nr:glycosyltransferase family A protein [Ideonella sp. BN130291]